MKYLWIILICSLALAACSAEQEFVDDRLQEICNEAYWICGQQAGCVLDNDHYVEGAFPGAARVVIPTTERLMNVRVRIFLKTMKSSGTEFLVQLYEPDCILDSVDGKYHLTEVDLFEEAGDDRQLIVELKAHDEGEHLIEIYSDASTEYLLIVETSAGD